MDLDLSKFLQIAGNFQNVFDQLSEKLEKEKIDINIGGGMVKLTLNGLGKVEKLEIDQEIFNSGDKEMLEDMLTAAFETAIQRLKELLQGTLTSTFMENLPFVDMLKDLMGEDEQK